MADRAAVMGALFKVFAVLALVAATYHCVALFHRVNDSPLWRHALFMTIDLVCVFGFLKRPRWFVWLFALLAIQQCYAHGGAFLRRFLVDGHASSMDLGVVLFMATALACLIAEDNGLRGGSPIDAGPQRR